MLSLQHDDAVKFLEDKGVAPAHARQVFLALLMNFQKFNGFSERQYRFSERQR